MVREFEVLYLTAELYLSSLALGVETNDFLSLCQVRHRPPATLKDLFFRQLIQMPKLKFHRRLVPVPNTNILMNGLHYIHHLVFIQIKLDHILFYLLV